MCVCTNRAVDQNPVVAHTASPRPAVTYLYRERFVQECPEQNKGRYVASRALLFQACSMSRNEHQSLLLFYSQMNAGYTECMRFLHVSHMQSDQYFVKPAGGSDWNGFYHPCIYGLADF